MRLASEVKLLLKTFNQREVSFITGLTVSMISRIANNKIKKYEDAPVAAQLEEFSTRASVVTYLRQVNGIPGSGSLTKRDAQYMKILKICGTKLEDVKNYYRDIPPGEIRDMWNYCQNQGLTTFDFELLKMQNSDILILKHMLGI